MYVVAPSPSVISTGVASRADPVHRGALNNDDPDEAEPEKIDDIARVMNSLEVHKKKAMQPTLGQMASWVKKCGHVEQHAFDKLIGLMIIDLSLPYSVLDCSWLKMAIMTANPKLTPLSVYRLKKYILPELKADVLEEMEKVFLFCNRFS